MRVVIARPPKARQCLDQPCRLAPIAGRPCHPSPPSPPLSSLRFIDFFRVRTFKFKKVALSTFRWQNPSLLRFPFLLQLSSTMARYDLTPVLEDSFRCFQKPCSCKFCPSVTKGTKRPLRETEDERRQQNLRKRQQRSNKKAIAQAKRQVKAKSQSTITSFFDTAEPATGS